MAYLESLSHLAAILTAGVAVWAYGAYQYGRRQQRIRLGKLPQRGKQAGVDLGKRSILHLVAQLGMTEGQVNDAAFRSKSIRRRVSPDRHGIAGTLMLEYTTCDEEEDMALSCR